MNAVELFNASGKPAGVWHCGECRIVKRTQEEAEQCCKPWICKKCGKETEKRFHSLCWDCERAAQWERHLERLEKAEEIADNGDPVFNDDRYFSSMEDYLEYVAGYGLEAEPFLYAATWQPYTLDLDRILEHADEQHPTEDEYYPSEHCEGMVELRAAVDAFNELNKNVGTWDIDYKRKVRVPVEDLK